MSQLLNDQNNKFYKMICSLSSGFPTSANVDFLVIFYYVINISQHKYAKNE